MPGFPNLSKEKLDFIAEKFYESEKVVWERDRSLTGNKTCDIVKSIPAHNDPKLGIYIDGALEVLEPSLPCYFRFPTNEEAVTGLYLPNDHLVIFYGSDMDESEMLRIEDRLYTVMTKKFNPVSGRCNIHARRTEE